MRKTMFNPLIAAKSALDKRRLTRRWFEMAHHDGQARYSNSSARYNVCACGRRSGKTEKAKRKLVTAAMTCHIRGARFHAPQEDPRFFAAAPTRDQTKRIFWRDIKALIPRTLLLAEPNESSLTIQLVNGAEIQCLGMDKPQRIEGTPWNGGVLDEYADMKADVWPLHVQPMLVDRGGWCDLIGVPEGRNHYYDLWKRAEACEIEDGERSEWRRHHWVSAEVLPLYGRGDELEAARRDMDELTFQQEFEASFVSFTGRAYWPFSEVTHCAKLAYDPRTTLIFCFDFNVDPGVAVVCQEQALPSGHVGTGVIGEVWIPRGSNTIHVCRKLITDWGRHEGRITCFGDVTGGARGSAKVLGSDWQLVREVLWDHFGKSREKVGFDLPQANPRERDRVNAVNSRLMSLAGEVKLMVDPRRAPHVVRDLEGVTVLEGGSGEIDKATNLELTHVSDALGYYQHRKWPVKRRYARTERKYWK